MNRSPYAPLLAGCASTTLGSAATPVAAHWHATLPHCGQLFDLSFRASMAIVVIGGLITLTFLSLHVNSIVFTYADDAVQWTRRHAHKPRHHEPVGSDGGSRA